MLIKRCPFCGNFPKQLYINNDKEYCIFCENCKDNGIQVKVVSNTKEKAQNLWNNQYIYNILKNKSIDALHEIKNYTNAEINNSNELLQLNNMHLGYFILPNGEVLSCNDSHPQVLLNYLNLETEDNKFTDASICEKFKIIRLSIYDKYVMISFPDIYNNKQYLKCLDVVYSIKLLLIKDKFYINHNNKIYQSNKFDEFLLKLEEYK